MAAADPPDPPDAEVRPGRARLLLDLMRRERADRAPALRRDVDDDERLLVAPLVAGDEQFGILCCLVRGRSFSEEDAELLRAVANQTAVGLKKAELIERLTAENIVKDMFEALAAGSVEAAEAKAGEARCDLSRPHAFAHVERAARTGTGRPGPSSPRACRPGCAGSTGAPSSTPATTACGRCCRSRRPAATGSTSSPGRCDEIGRELGVELGLSGVDRGASSARRRMREAADAARIGRSLAGGGGAILYEQLGAYRYLVHLELEQAPHDRYGQAVEALIDYDSRRGAQLVETLERYLGARCSVAASARALYIHPNTVRQRLERIGQVTGLDLRTADLLSLELALKVARLHHAGEPATPGKPGSRTRA